MCIYYIYAYKRAFLKNKCNVLEYIQNTLRTILLQRFGMKNVKAN